MWVPVKSAEEYAKDFNFQSNYGANKKNIIDDSLPSGITDESVDVVKYGGLYIGRYEAGCHNHKNSTFEYIDSSGNKVIKSLNSSVKILTGSAEYTNTKYIYDLAGNVWEWTNQVRGSHRINHSGSYSSDGDIFPFSFYNSCDISHTSDNVRFRSRIYIK